MKTTRVWAVVSVLAALLMAGAASARSTAFMLINDTAFTVYSVHVWPSYSSNMRPDRLGRGTISSGATRTFNPGDDDCVYNVRVSMEDDSNPEQWNEVDLCEVSFLTLHYNYFTQSLTASTN